MASGRRRVLRPIVARVKVAEVVSARTLRRIEKRLLDAIGQNYAGEIIALARVADEQVRAMRSELGERLAEIERVLGIYRKMRAGVEALCQARFRSKDLTHYCLQPAGHSGLHGGSGGIWWGDNGAQVEPAARISGNIVRTV